MTLSDDTSTSARQAGQPRQSLSPEPPGRSSPPQTTYLTGTSQLPIRNRSRMASARTTPYSLSQSPRYLSAGDRANIPRTAQFHAVGMPARHPLGIQLETMQSDASTDSADSASDHGSAATTRAVDNASVAETIGGVSPTTPQSSGQESSAVAPEGDDGEFSQQCLMPLGMDDSNSMDEAEPAAIAASAGMAVSQSDSKLRSAPSPPAINRNSVGGAVSLSCPICLEPMREAFMTACGHSFCYQCISRHLCQRQSCPTCLHALERDQVFPNFALDRLISTMDSSVLRPSSIVQQLRNTVESDETLDPQDIDALLSMLQHKKQLLRNSEKQFEMSILRQFLTTARSKKASAIESLRRELRLVEEDLGYAASQLEQNAPCDDEFGEGRQLSKPSTLSHYERARAGDAAGAQVPNAVSAEDSASERLPLVSVGSTSATAAAAAERAKHSRRVDEHYNDLEAYYFNHRMRGVGEEGLDEFLETLTTVARYERFRQVATLRYGDTTASTAIVASIEFDRDEEIFAVAGVARKIKIYDYANVVQQADSWNEYAAGKSHLQRSRQSMGQKDWWYRDVEAAEEEPPIASAMMQYPAAEYTNRSKISCLSFNPYIKAQLACSDYDGTVSLWDVNAGAPTLSLGEHEKRAWSLDFSHVDPTRLCSGSDDGKVKIWTTNRRSSVMTIEGKANVCCVRFNPLHGNILSFGSADHNVHCFDLRSPKQPLCVLRGHRKAVSYTRFLTPDEIISASTDSSLKLWNLRTQECVRTFTGHSNEKNFVGLTTCGGDWIACGSENNTMYAYYRNLSHPAVTHRFGNCDPATGMEQAEDDPSLFVSAVCWKNKTNTLLSANSQGIIKVLEMV
ncbi:hypothetical protein EV183_002920 [Coemansia sp. RSA 2336]|nr:hypothetical protein EV183_002920 [Coemansia sp. RSA 2336]